MNCKYCDENVNDGYALKCLFIVSIDFRDGVNDLNVSANKSVSSSFVFRMTYMNI